MIPSDPLKQITQLYHFTDTRNLPLIKQHDGIYPMGDLKRGKVTIPAPGGNQWSQDADARSKMDEYVHLCFKSQHPMEYLARQDGRIVDSIFLKIDPSVLLLPGVKFSNGVSNSSDAAICSIEEARSMIDFQVLYTKTKWSDPAIQQRLAHAEKCEILVPHRIPVSLIRNMP